MWQPRRGDATGSVQVLTAALTRGNFTLCLQGRKVGLDAAKAHGGQNSISNTRVKSEEKSVRLDSGLKNGVRSGGHSASIAKATMARETMKGTANFQGDLLGSACPRRVRAVRPKRKTSLWTPQCSYGGDDQWLSV